MAATKLIAMHQNKGRSVIQCLKDRTDYGLSVIQKVKPSERQKRTKYPDRVSMRDIIREDILKCLD